jgi:hypothetical protein
MALTQSKVSDDMPTVPLVAPNKKPTAPARPSRISPAWIAGGLVLLSLLLAGAIYRWSQQPSVVSSQRGNGSGGPSSADSDPERTAAQWVLSVGGNVAVVTDSPDNEIGVPSVDPRLPARPFYLSVADLRAGQAVDDAGLAKLAGCRHLKILYLHGAKKVTGAGWHSLRNTGLKELALNDLPYGTPDDVAELPPTLEIFIPLSASLNDASLSRWPTLPKLRQLVLNETKISDAGLKTIAERCPNLQEIEMRIDGPASLKSLASLQSMETVCCRGDQITAESGRVLRELPQFQRLIVHVPRDEPLARLGLLGDKSPLRLELKFWADGNVTDTGYRSLTALTGMTELVIEGRERGSPTDEALLDLAKLPKLKLLVLGYPPDTRRFTEAGIMAFRRLQPSVDLQLGH